MSWFAELRSPAGSARGSSSAAWGRPRRAAPARPAPPSRYVLDGGELAGHRRARRRRARGRGGRGPAHQPERLGGAGVPRARSPTSSSRSCMRPSRRLEKIPPYLFAELERKIAAKRAAGVDVISLGIGDPGHADLPADRRRRAGGGRRSEHPPVPVEPRAAGVPRGGRRVLRAPLRRRRSTRRPR